VKDRSAQTPTPAAQPQHGSDDDAQQQSLRSFNKSITALIKRKGVFARTGTVKAQEIGAEQVLVNERACSYRALFERALRAEGVPVTRSLELLSVEAIKQCALASLGIAVLPEVVVQRELKQGGLVALDWPRKPLVVYTQLYRHRDKWMSPVMTAFWQMAVGTCAEKAEVPDSKKKRR
jgi:DNA-binding transcriptional LysR family regulator